MAETSFVGPLLVVDGTEMVEGCLLGSTMSCWWPRRLCLHRAVHAFMAAVLFRMSGAIRSGMMPSFIK